MYSISGILNFNSIMLIFKSFLLITVETRRLLYFEEIICDILLHCKLSVKVIQFYEIVNLS